MLYLSPEVAQAVDQPARFIKQKVIIYFDGMEPQVFDSDNRIVDCSILEEVSTDGKTPLGDVTTNELTVTLLNFDKAFTINNKEGQYFGKLLPNVKVKVFYLIETTPDHFEEIPMGTYYTSEWQSNSDSGNATVTCYDILSIWGQYDIPQLEVKRNMPLATAITTVLKAVGLTEEQFVIDTKISYVLPFVWFPKVKLIKYLQMIASGYGCLVYVNRQNVLVFKYARKMLDPVAVISDENQITGMKLQQSSLDLYSTINIKFGMYQQSKRELLLELKEYTLHPGENHINNLVFSKCPCVYVESVMLSGALTSQVEQMNYDSWNASLVINNTQDQDEQVDIRIYGYMLEKVQVTKTVTNSNLLNSLGMKPLELDTEIIQDEQAAQTFANTLLSMVSNYDTKLEIPVRGNPLLELGDTVTIQDPSDGVVGDYLLLRADYKYTGSLESTITVAKVGE